MVSRDVLFDEKALIQRLCTDQSTENVVELPKLDALDDKQPSNTALPLMAGMADTDPVSEATHIIEDRNAQGEADTNLDSVAAEPAI